MFSLCMRLLFIFSLFLKLLKQTKRKNEKKKLRHKKARDKNSPLLLFFLFSFFF